MNIIELILKILEAIIFRKKTSIRINKGFNSRQETGVDQLFGIRFEVLDMIESNVNEDEIMIFCY